MPAFTDSELGLDYALTNRERDKKGKPRFRFDPFEDLEHFAATLLSQKRLGIFTIGGGVHATGRSSSGHSSNCAIAAAGKTCR